MQSIDLFQFPQALFKDRKDAGQKLADKLIKYKDNDSIVLALPRGGVVVGYEVSQKLNIPLDVIVVRKIGAPDQPELGIGAIAENNTLILDHSSITYLGYLKNQVDKVIADEKKEMQRRIDLYRNTRPLPEVKNKTVILVDDGLATGVTASAAVDTLLKLKPEKLVLAVPVCSNSASQSFKNKVDDFICLHAPYDFRAIGIYYQNFEQTTDEEVIDLLKKVGTGFKPVPTDN